MEQRRGQDSKRGWVFNIQRYSIQDGPGIRTTVFMKGCPLRCHWCSNPESQALHPELLYFNTRCTKCGKCIKACPNGGTILGSEGEIVIDRGLCKAYGACVDSCLAEARVIAGKLMTIADVVDVVKQDSLFYRNSNGGVTFSGGEPTYQPAFLLELLMECQRQGFHTCLDTCAYIQWEVLEEILQYVDLILFDIKHMNSERHKELTGVDNILILDNLNRIMAMGKEIIVRVPLLSGMNDSEENINATGNFISELGIKRVDLLPYHKLGVKKYERLEMEYRLKELRSLKREEVEDIKEVLENFGLEVDIV